jgi:hypothetical protein
MQLLIKNVENSEVTSTNWQKYCSSSQNSEIFLQNSRL